MLLLSKRKYLVRIAFAKDLTLSIILTNQYRQPDHRPQLAGCFCWEDLLQLLEEAIGRVDSFLTHHIVGLPIIHRHEVDNGEVDTMRFRVVQQTNAGIEP